MTITGMKEINEDDYEEYKGQLEEREGKFIYFTDYDQDIVKWGYMKIKVTPIK